MRDVRPYEFEPCKDERLVHLTRGFTALIDATDWPLIEPYSWHTHFARSKVYARARDAKRGVLYLHRLITDAPEGKPVDHENSVSLDCRRFNLVVKGVGANAQNCARRFGASGFRGVTERNGRFKSEIKVDGAGIYLGTFATAQEAADAYDAAAVTHHGPGAWTNRKHLAATFNPALAEQVALMTELVETFDNIPF